MDLSPRVARAFEVGVIPDVRHAKQELLQSSLTVAPTEQSFAEDLPVFRLSRSSVLRRPDLERLDQLVIQVSYD
jgi:hypothetical protein